MSKLTSQLIHQSGPQNPVPTTPKAAVYRHRTRRVQLHASIGLSLAMLGGCSLFPPQPASATSPDESGAAPLAAPAAPPPIPDELMKAVNGMMATPPEQAPAVDENERQAEAQYYVLTGEMAAGRDMPAVAAEAFLKALELVPNKTLAARATALALNGRREDLALAAARQWRKTDPDNVDPAELLTRLDVRAGDMDDALKQARFIVKNFAGGADDGLHHIALLISQDSGHANESVQLMKTLADEYPQRAAAHTALGLVNFRFNHLETAESEARTALKLKPGDRDTVQLLAGILVKQHRIVEADVRIDELARSSKNGVDIRLAYARLLLEDSSNDPGHEAARRALMAVLKTDPDNASAHYALGLMDLEDQKLDSAEAHLRPLTTRPSAEKSADKSAPATADHRQDAWYFLGRIAELRGKPSDALDLYSKVTSGSQALDASMRRAALLGRQNQVQAAREIYEQLRRQYTPLTNRFYAAEGEMLINSGDAPTALEVFNKALSLTPGDSDLLYSRSLAYEHLNQVNSAEADLRSILSKSPDDARAINALGYMLTVHTSRLDEAQKLVSRALELSPEDPAVIDSMGWIQYKSGHIKEALPYLQKAMGIFPDAEVAAHLGEVLWMLGEREQAEKVWKSAQKNDPENAALQETIQRLTQPQTQKP